MLLVSDQFNLILSVFPELPHTHHNCATDLGEREATYPQRRQATFVKTEQILDATKRKKCGSAQEAKDRRRERNKELARKTRLRKKEELDQLRDLVESLQKENQRLVVDIIKSEIPDLLRMAGDRS